MTLQPSRIARVAGAVLVATLLPTATAHAADAPSGETAAVVSGLASDAAHALAEERDLVDAAATGSADALDRLVDVDEHGQSLLDQLDRAGADLSPSIRATLASMPTATDDIAAVAPRPAVYAAAIAGLDRIAATPAAALPDSGTTGEATGELLAVAVAALILLAAAARASSRSNAELAAAAWNDDLTGVANRRRLVHDLGIAGDPEVGPTSVIMVDVDELRSVNADYGLDAGDDVIREVAAMLSANVRAQDVVYRSGAEEFCVLLAGATISEAHDVAARIVEAARAIMLPDRHVTISAGVAAGAPQDVGATLHQADLALFQAKASGCDQVAVARSLQPA